MYILNKSEILAPGISLYENVIDDTQRFIDLALKSDGWDDAKVGEGEVLVDIRKTKKLGIVYTYSNPIEWFELYQTMWRYADEYAKSHDFSFHIMEDLQILHYSVDNDRYNSHYDYMSDNGSHRVFSSVFYLNDVEEGGETYFDKFDISVKPKKGRLIIFPANYPYTHEARTPKSNDKFSLVTWYRAR